MAEDVTRLHIKGAEREDTGRYQLEVENQFGVERVFADVRVLGMWGSML